MIPLIDIPPSSLLLLNVLVFFLIMAEWTKAGIYYLFVVLTGIWLVPTLIPGEFQATGSLLIVVMVYAAARFATSVKLLGRK